MNNLLVLDSFIIKIYQTQSNNNLYDLIDLLNTKIYPRDIVETLETIDGTNKIEVYDKTTEVLLLSTTIL